MTVTDIVNTYGRSRNWVEQWLAAGFVKPIRSQSEHFRLYKRAEIGKELGRPWDE